MDGAASFTFVMAGVSSFVRWEWGETSERGGSERAH